MDFLSIRDRLREGARKYRTVLLVVLAGIFLMAIPERRPVPPTPEKPKTELSQELSALLSSVEGAGRVRVLLTAAGGEETVYQSDGDSRTVVISDGQRGEQGLVRQVKPPRYRGAVVLSQGAGNAAVRLCLVEAVSKATGLTSDRISVLKMK